jgi:alpha-beta hydrolase superfamily lysophospholipase
VFYRQWPAHEPARNAVFVIHRGHEHSGRLHNLVDELNLPECAIFAWDARGHGRSPGTRGDAGSDVDAAGLRLRLPRSATKRGAR